VNSWMDIAVAPEVSEAELCYLTKDKEKIRWMTP
jgi:hypothetical protein